MVKRIERSEICFHSGHEKKGDRRIEWPMTRVCHMKIRTAIAIIQYISEASADKLQLYITTLRCNLEQVYSMPKVLVSSTAISSFSNKMSTPS